MKMNKILVIFWLVVICAFLTVGLKVYIGEDHWVTWDNITYTGEGIVTYVVYLESTEHTGFFDAITEVSDPPVYLGAYMPDNKVQQNVGVQAKITDIEGEHVSTINWSYIDEPVGATPVPFGWLLSVPSVTGLTVYEAPAP